jgi:hypothetical protein
MGRVRVGLKVIDRAETGRDRRARVRRRAGHRKQIGRGVRKSHGTARVTANLAATGRAETGADRIDPVVIGLVAIGRAETGAARIGPPVLRVATDAIGRGMDKVDQAGRARIDHGATVRPAIDRAATGAIALAMIGRRVIDRHVTRTARIGRAEIGHREIGRGEIGRPGTGPGRARTTRGAVTANVRATSGSQKARGVAIDHGVRRSPAAQNARL